MIIEHPHGVIETISDGIEICSQCDKTIYAGDPVYYLKGAAIAFCSEGCLVPLLGQAAAARMIHNDGKPNFGMS